MNLIYVFAGWIFSYLLGAWVVDFFVPCCTFFSQIHCNTKLEFVGKLITE